MKRSSHSKRPHRPGVALLVAIVAMALAAALMISLLQILSLERRVVDRQTEQLQNELWLESALRRGMAQRALNANYQGERWEPQAPGAASAAPLVSIDISVAASKDEKPDRITVQIQRADGTPAAQRTTEIPEARSER